ncbi:MAG: hypothetical protein IT326_09585, partial [Anaerolineae bacterium]|nr:hypothetical protein [Anaerolineae bacterium]
AETVIIEVTATDQPVSDWGNLASDRMTAHVEASFAMQNQGSEAESFDVWFPIGLNDGWGGVQEVSNFRAWVNGEEAPTGRMETTNEFEQRLPWATWPASFPPGEPVDLRVSYDFRPTGYAPYGDFEYILETGAGWYGPIGEGTIVVRLPYEVSEYTVPGSHMVYPSSPARDQFIVSGNEMTWHFSELEPIAENNVRFVAMIPQVWEHIMAAEDAVRANPKSATALRDLAQAREAGLEFKYELVCCQPLADLTIDAYRRAVALAPDDPDVVAAYVTYLSGLWFPYAGSTEGMPEDFLPMLARGLMLAPENEELLLLKGLMDEMNVTLPEPAAPIAPPGDPLMASTRAATPVPAPTLTTVPTLTPAPSAAAEVGVADKHSPLPFCPAPGLLLLPLGALITRRRTPL